MVDTSQDFIKTSNTALAAYLISEGCTLYDVEYAQNGIQAFFIFENDSKTLKNYIRDFEMMRAMGNIVLFFNSYQSLLRRIKEGY